MVEGRSERVWLGGEVAMRGVYVGEGKKGEEERGREGNICME